MLIAVIRKLLPHELPADGLSRRRIEYLRNPVKIPCRSASVGIVEMRVTPISCFTPW